MAINTKQQEIGLKWLGNIRRKYWSEKSEAAEWWDKLSPEWRGVVLHATAVNSGLDVFKAHLCKCCWCELYERLNYREMIQLKLGISRARLTFEGFGSLSDSDFSRRTASRPARVVNQIYSSNGVQMVVAPQFVSKMQLLQQQENH
ncbi:hypothetical protein HV318_21135 [Enterobacter sp. RHBSTW-00901]|uniref:hypothetical protein n=1 Tax=Enterobacter sp. RHBSTW-00901 TaxID=2742669 RepID=UPI0015F3DBD5|nr:hypothetical protein [Enterobacter sp. RHBSTW-00901]MBA7857449.1 hypothetical protein [Enterobacter sp. RHBSTW-00901]